MICILGCLDTEEGLKICKEMREWLDKEHSVFVVHQTPPGNMFEYPAIKYAIDTAITLNEPVLYLHTKGAGNKIPLNYKTAMMSPNVNFPKEAKPEDCQKIVRLMWKKEFTGDRLKEYEKIVNTNLPTVVCPFTGKEKLTWQNGFIINPAAAKEIKKTFHFDKNRWYYEQLFVNTTINVIGLVSSNIHVGKNELDMWNLIWKYF